MGTKRQGDETTGDETTSYPITIQLTPHRGFSVADYTTY
jgi:hypothetical protein